VYVNTPRGDVPTSESLLIQSSMALQPFVGPWPLLQFCNLFTQSVWPLWRGISLLQGRYLHRGQHKQSKRTQTYMPWVGFEPTIPVFERAMTVHALDRAATVITGLSSTRAIFTFICMNPTMSQLYYTAPMRLTVNLLLTITNKLTPLSHALL
jgi:hypothetical protein